MDLMRLQDGGYPFTIESIEFMQNAYKKALEKLSLVAGRNVIIDGVEIDGADVTDGVIIYNGEILPFIGGVHSATVIIYEAIEQVEYNEDADGDGNLDLKEAHVQRFAKCGVGGVANFPFTDLKRVRSLQNTRILGETMPWAGQLSKIPEGWLQAAGQTLNTVDYPELFDALGYSHGGLGATFKLPNLKNRVPVGAGGDYALGASGGEKNHQLSAYEMPSHSHAVRVKKGVMGASVDDNPGGNGESVRRTMDPEIDYAARTENEGSNGSHNNMQPYTALNYIIYVGV